MVTVGSIQTAMLILQSELTPDQAVVAQLVERQPVIFRSTDREPDSCSTSHFVVCGEWSEVRDSPRLPRFGALALPTALFKQTSILLDNHLI